MKVSLVEFKFTAPRRAQIKVKEIPGWLARLFGKRDAVIEYSGWCTVWHQLPNYIRASSARERTLSEFWQAHKWEQEV